MTTTDFYGKYMLWPNGLIFKVIGPDPKYPESQVVLECPIRGNSWSSTLANLDEKYIITEQEAKKQYAKIEVGVGSQVQVCSCCNWKAGKPQLRLFFDLQQGKIPENETYRIRDILYEFFQGDYIPYVHPTATGVELEFYKK